MARVTSSRLIGRAADLVAAGLAAVADFYEGEFVIVAEGSLFWGDPKFPGRCLGTLERLLRGRKAKIVHVAEANLIGSACAALIP